MAGINSSKREFSKGNIFPDENVQKGKYCLL
jgi:hypothetical protein